MNTKPLEHMFSYPAMKRTSDSKIPTFSSKAINKQMEKFKSSNGHNFLNNLKPYPNLPKDPNSKIPVVFIA